MMQVQVDIRVADDGTRIDLNVLEREDANDSERKIANVIQKMHLSALVLIQGEGVDVGVTTIEKTLGEVLDERQHD